MLPIFPLILEVVHGMVNLVFLDISEEVTY